MNINHCMQIKVLDRSSFRSIALKHPLIKAYNDPQWYARNYKSRGRWDIEQKIKDSFPFLFNHVFRPIECHHNAPGYADCYVCAIGSDGLAGVAKLAHFPGTSLSYSMLQSLEEQGNGNALEKGFDCLTALSVSLSYRGRKLSKLILEHVFREVQLRHSVRGGMGGALLKLSSFEPLGKERLLARIKKLAAKNPGVLVGFSHMDQIEFGEILLADEVEDDSCIGMCV